MVKNFTLEELVMSMYNESSNFRDGDIEREMGEDWVMKEKYAVLKESADRINRMKLHSPRQQTIDAIMKYANRTSKITSR